MICQAKPRSRNGSFAGKTKGGPRVSVEEYFANEPFHEGFPNYRALTGTTDIGCPREERCLLLAHANRNLCGQAFHDIIAPRVARFQDFSSVARFPRVFPALGRMAPSLSVRSPDPQQRLPVQRVRYDDLNVAFLDD